MQPTQGVYRPGLPESRVRQPQETRTQVSVCSPWARTDWLPKHTHSQKSSLFTHIYMRWTQQSLQSVACAGLGWVSLSATVVKIKPVCAAVQCDCLLVNDKLIHSGSIEEGCLLPVQVGAAVSVLWISTAVVSAGLCKAEVFACPLSCRLKQPALRSPDGNCQPCPISSTGPVCGSDGHNYASKVHRSKYTPKGLGNNSVLSVYLYLYMIVLFYKTLQPNWAIPS